MANSIHQKFICAFHWNLVGSISYESLKVLHCFLLFTRLDPVTCGFVGSLFSVIYLITRIADFGATNSIPPFHNLFTRNKENFRYFLIRYSLIPHLPLILGGVIMVALIPFFGTFATVLKIHLPTSIRNIFDALANWAAPLTINNMTLYLVVLPLIIILETIRSFFRQFLHTIFQSKTIVIAELIIFIGYLASIWIPHFIYEWPLTLNLIFIPHLADSMLALIVFMVMVHNFYKTLPHGHANLPPQLWKRLAATKSFNYLLRVTRHMFTSNFLTPLFAVKFGLKAAGIFYFASTLANTTQAIVRSLVNYSGGALFASLKDASQAEKKHAFDLIAQKLVRIVAPCIIFMIINYRSIIRLGQSGDITDVTFSLALLFLIISFTEFFFILYEQFYIIEEAADKLLVFKLFEVAIFYGLVTLSPSESQVATLASIIFIRVFSFVVIAVNAYYNWKIIPNFKTNHRLVAFSLMVSLLVAYFL